MFHLIGWKTFPANLCGRSSRGQQHCLVLLLLAFLQSKTGHFIRSFSSFSAPGFLFIYLLILQFVACLLLLPSFLGMRLQEGRKEVSFFSLDGLGAR